MAAETQLTIVLKVRDATKRALDGIKRSVSGALLVPFQQLGRDVGDVLKKLVSLKTYAAAGAAGLALTAQQTLALSRNAREFSAAFSPEEQSQIDRTAEAIRRLGAQLQRTLGVVVADGSDGISTALDSVTLWLRDNGSDIRAFFRDVREFFRDVTTFTRAVSSGRVKPADLLASAVGDQGKGGRSSALLENFGVRLGADPRGAAARIKFGFAEQKESDSFRRAVEALDKLGAKSFADAVDNVDVIRETLRGMADNPAAASALAAMADAGEDATAQMDAAADAVVRFRVETTDTTQVTATFISKVREMAAANKVERDAIRALVPDLQTLEDAYDSAAQARTKSVDKIIDRWRELTDSQVLIAGFLKFGDVISAFSSSFDSAFDSVIDGTRGIASAFKDMTVSVIGDIGKLLVKKTILDLLRSTFAFVTGGPSVGTVIEDSLSGRFGGFASGGPVRRGGVYNVGETGRERVYLPQGAYVQPSHRSRDEGGAIQIFVNGARDAAATAREIVQQLARNGRLRSAVQAV